MERDKMMQNKVTIVIVMQKKLLIVIIATFVLCDHFESF